MELELRPRLWEPNLTLWKNFLIRQELTPDNQAEQIALLWDQDRLIGTGSRQGSLLKCIAVDPEYRGQDLTSSILTALRQNAFEAGHRHLFLYTKPQNKHLFSSLFFYPIAQTDQVLLMENQKDGILDFLNHLPAASSEDGPIGAAVMNCNPFTLGHRHLIKTAAGECRHLYVFVLSEDKSYFSADDRFEMVRLGTQDLPNVTVLPTGPYLISSATFPTYFLKDREHAEEIHCLFDLELFTQYFAPRFSITRRYVGTEELSPITARYNEALKNHLPAKGIEVKEIPRLCQANTPVSASQVRTLLEQGEISGLLQLVPQSTFDYLQAKNLLHRR